jgi:hypothetical protein
MVGMKTLSTILIGILLTQSVLAAEVKYLEKGQTAPFTGYLIEPELEKEFRLMDKKLEFSTQLNTSYEGLVKSYAANEAILNKRVEICQVQNEKLSKPSSNLGWMGTFLLGAGTAILIMFAHGKINK